MEPTWMTVRKGLLALLRRPAARASFDEMKASCPDLRPWQAPGHVASFLSRQTPHLGHRKRVLRALLGLVAEGGPRAELAGTILLLAGVLAMPRLRRRKSGGPAPAMPCVFVLGHPLTTAAKERPLAASLLVPALAAMPTGIHAEVTP